MSSRGSVGHRVLTHWSFSGQRDFTLSLARSLTRRGVVKKSGDFIAPGALEHTGGKSALPHTHTHTRTRTHTRTHRRGCMHTHTHTHRRGCIHTHTHTHTRGRTHTHTHTHPPLQT